MRNVWLHFVCVFLLDNKQIFSVRSFSQWNKWDATQKSKRLIMSSWMEKTRKKALVLTRKKDVKKFSSCVFLFMIMDACSKKFCFLIFLDQTHTHKAEGSSKERESTENAMRENCIFFASSSSSSIFDNSICVRVLASNLKNSFESFNNATPLFFLRERAKVQLLPPAKLRPHIS